MTRSSKLHTRCRLLSKLMNIFVDVPGGSGFVGEVALSTASRSLVFISCTLCCVPYDGCSLLVPRCGLCFLLRCIPRGQLMAVLWH